MLNAEMSAEREDGSTRGGRREPGAIRAPHPWEQPLEDQRREPLVARAVGVGEDMEGIGGHAREVAVTRRRLTRP